MTRLRSLLGRVREDRGSAVTEFPLVAALITILALSLIQVALFLHVRNSLTDAAVQGAYYAALEGNEASDGAERALHVAQSRFGSLMSVEADAESVDGVMRVRLRGQLPVIAFLGPARGLVVEGFAVNEDSL